MSSLAKVGSVFGAACAATIALASPANALEAKQCLPMAEMNAALKAEGQRTMIIGDRMALQNPTGKVLDASVSNFVNTVTSNADGSLGYQLEGDLPRSQNSTSVCVRAKLANVRLYDARANTVPQAAYLGGKFDALVREYSSKAVRPMVIADTVHGSEGNERRGLPLVVFGHATGRSAAIITRMPDGQPQFLVQMGQTDYTAAGLARLNTQVAMLTPR